MEFNLQPVNNTTTATHTTLRAGQSSAYSWRVPAFFTPRTPAHTPDSDRVRGEIHSKRPRWTKEKHARILA